MATRTKNQADRQWPAEKIERRPIGELLAYPQNPMLHSDEQVQQIANSITEYGWTIPVLVDESGVLIAGHARIRAAQLLGIADVPTMVARGWSAEQKKSYRIFDNQAPRLADWNVDLLRIELNDLKLADYPLELTGFDNLQLVEFMAGVPAGKDPEATPEPPATPVSKRGDIWVLGQHRLMCGDATSAEDVERLLDGAKPHLMVTDPPYGVDYDASWRDSKGEFSRRGFAPGPVLMRGTVSNDDRADWTPAWALFGGDVAYVWSAPGALQIVSHNALVASDFDIRYQIIWCKSHFAMSRGDYHWHHEPCWYAVRKGKTGHWQGDRKQTTLWQIESLNPVGRKGGQGYGDDEKTGHSTQKPIECMKRPIENNSQPGDAVYEPFSGSFTTGIACEVTGRRCYAMEVAPEYVDMGVLRWQQLTGKEARLNAPGNPTYAEVQADRAKPARKRKRERATA
jgi:DNA modification methylase